MFQTYAEPPYAGFWIRFLAYVIDSILLSLIFCPLGLGIGLLLRLRVLIRIHPR